MGKNPFKNIIDEVKSSSIELSSNKRMVVTDCKYVADYSKERIVLNIGELDVEVTGEELVLSGFSYGETCIEGTIVSIGFRNS